MTEQPYVPATEALFPGWTGPVVYDGQLAVILGPDAAYLGQWCLSRLEGFDVMNETTWCLCAEARDIRLDTRRREVQHLLCDRLNLTEWVRGSEWCAALTWWAALSGRTVRALLGAWSDDRRALVAGEMPRAHTVYGRLNRPDAWWTAADGSHGLGFAPALADTAATGSDFALLNDVDGRLVLTLPSLVAGGGPIVWSPS